MQAGRPSRIYERHEIKAKPRLRSMARWITRKLCIAALGLVALASPAWAADDRPVVLELFTAQGCSACPETHTALERISRDPKVLILTYGVDYWDYLGWRDTFARPEFTERQRDYRQTFGLRSVATPQVVIDGHSQITAQQSALLDNALSGLPASPLPPPDIEFRTTGDRVAVGSGRAPSGGADVVAVRYTPGLKTVEVRTGDNQGQSIRHINVVKEIRYLGDWSGRPALYNLPPDLSAHALNEDALIVMVQGKQDRRILSTARLQELRHD